MDGNEAWRGKHRKNIDNWMGDWYYTVGEGKRLPLIKPRWPLSVCFLIMGTVFLFGSGFHAWKTIDFYFIKDSSEAEAKITKIEIIEKRKGDTYNVYVSFEPDNGKLQTSLLDTYVEGMVVGDTVKIIYDRNNPGEIILWWSSPLLLAVFGGTGLLIIMITLMVRRNKRIKNAA